MRGLKSYLSFLTLTVFFLAQPALADSCAKADQFEVWIQNKQGSLEKSYQLGQDISVPNSNIVCKVLGSWQQHTVSKTISFPRFSFPDEQHVTLSCSSKSGFQLATHASLASAATGFGFLGMPGNAHPSEALLIGANNDPYYIYVRCSKILSKRLESGRTKGSIGESAAKD